MMTKKVNVGDESLTLTFSDRRVALYKTKPAAGETVLLDQCRGEVIRNPRERIASFHERAERELTGAAK
jgi:hypothetical protein